MVHGAAVILGTLATQWDLSPNGGQVVSNRGEEGVMPSDAKKTSEREERGADRALLVGIL